MEIPIHMLSIIVSDNYFTKQESFLKLHVNVYFCLIRKIDNTDYDTRGQNERFVHCAKGVR